MGAATSGSTDAAIAQRHKLLFNSSERFQVTGRLAQVDDSKGEITIQRQNLPPALLRVEEGTKIQVDGRQGALSDLKPGSDVQASFNLSGRRPIALEVNATGTNK
jgi:hypothetical protein